LTCRAPLIAACAIAATVLVTLPSHAEAQRRVAVPRRAVVVRSPVVVRTRPTTFVGGYYYPNLYRTSLAYGYGGYAGFGVSFSYGYGGYYGYGPYYAGYYRPYYAGYYGPYYGGPYPYYPYGAYDVSGNVRTQVAPRQTEVFIDGYYAGTVDDFDGTFQRLNIEPGDHDVELYLPGHRPYQVSVYVQPGRTFNIRHTMEPLAPGEAEPARPAGAPLPPGGTPDPGQGARGPARDPRVAGPAPQPSGPESRAPVPESRAPVPGSRAAGPVAQGFGQLSLRVQPADAEVLIDGEKWEGGLDAERLAVQLGSGLHRLEIRKDGYRNYFTDITIGNGQTRTLNVVLTRQ
jgi:hypothetical protein